MYNKTGIVALTIDLQPFFGRFAQSTMSHHCRNIAISLIDLWKSETKSQACAFA
jgi:hypothetical protein